MNQIRSRCGRPSRLLPTLPWVTALLAILVASAPVLAEEDVRAPDPGDADAILISGTGMPTLRALAPAEERFERPVVSSNLCLAWAMTEELARRE